MDGYLHDYRISPKEFPDVDDIVMVDIKTINESGFYVSLLEFGNMEGFISFAEASRRATSRCTNTLRVGQQRPAIVIRLDRDKKYIDLSIKRITPDDNAKCICDFTHTKIIDGIIRQIAEKNKNTAKYYYENYIWKIASKYKDIYTIFKMPIQKIIAIFDELKIDNTKDRDDIIGGILKKMCSTKFRAYAEIDLMCLKNGIDDIKQILMAGEISVKNPAEFGCGDVDVHIQYVRAPTYSLSAMSLDKIHVLQTLYQSIDIMKRETEKLGGEMSVKMKPLIVGDDCVNEPNKISESDDESSDDSSDFSDF